MNEAMGQGPAPGIDPPASADVPSAGTLLRLAREEAGVHVATLAAALKVPVRKLEALEADRFDLLPDAVFVRALAASVCRNLKLDPAPVLQRLPATGGPRLAPSDGGINAPFRSPRDGAAPGWRDQLTRPVFLAVAALLLAALVVLLLPSRHDDGASQAVVPPQPASEPAPAPVPLVDAPRPAAPEPVMANAAPAAVVAAPAAASASAPMPVAAAAAASGIVVFRARAQAWVQVTDARGGVALRKLLAPGESAGVSGPLPLAVTVGSASATEVHVRGKPLDLAPLARDNVARFEVK